MENNLDHLVGDENHHKEIDEAIDDMQNWKHPDTWDQLQVGMEVKLLPINENYGWQKGTLQHYGGYKGEGLYNLDAYWYITAKFAGHYGPVTLMLKDLTHIKIPS